MKHQQRLISIVTMGFFFWGTLPAASGQSRKIVPIGATIGFRTYEGVVERQARSYLFEELEKSGRLSLVPEKVVDRHVQEIRRLEQKEASSSLAQAYQSFIKGKKLYDELEIDAAIKEFSKAVRGYREGIAALHENRYLLASHLYLGMSLVIRGRANEGREYIRQMVVLNPFREKQSLPSREFPPNIVSLHQDVTARVVNGPNGKVLIRSSPPGATVYFDGVKQMPTPLNIDKVPAGEHFVTIEKQGFRRFSRLVEVNDGELQVSADLEKWDPLAPQAFEHRNDPESIAFLTELGEMLGARILVLGDAEPLKSNRVRLQSQLFDTQSREFSRIERKEVSRGQIKEGASHLSQDLLNHLSVSGGVVTWLSPGDDVPGMTRSRLDRRADATPSISKGTPLYEKWWFWTLVGAVAIGGGAAALVLTKSDPNYNVLNVSNPLAP